MVEALQDISFTIGSGEIVGYIGPNGAGKSTTIKTMSGILVPDSGTCSIMGYTPWKDRVAYVKNIGVVFGQRSQLWWDVPVLDSFELLRDIYTIPPLEYRSYSGTAHRNAGSCTRCSYSRSPAQSWSAHALRDCRFAAAQSAASVPGRADDRARCRIENRRQAVHQNDQRGKRRYRHFDDPRYERYRSARKPIAAHRQR